jgi:hypothetical protein
VTIRTEDPDVPSEFPPARLFLDDIEEIVRILREFLESRKMGSHSTVEDLKISVRLSAGGKESDDVQELPKITKNNRELNISLTRGDWSQTSLHFHPWFGTLWRSLGLTKEDTWSAYHKLHTVFEKRPRRWSALLRSIPWWLTWSICIGVTLLFPFVLPFVRFQGHNLTLWYGTCITVLVIASVTGARHTTVVLRHSWEPSALRQELLHKLPLIVITSLLTFLLTLLGFYLKHKYWP